MLRIFLLFFGTLTLAIGFIGVFLPVLPTTPFVILAAACFARSSKKVHRWIHQNRYFGQTVKTWEETGTISLRAKRVSVGMLNFSIISSMILIGRNNIYALVILALTAIGVTGFILRIPTTGQEPMTKVNEHDS